MIYIKLFIKLLHHKFCVFLAGLKTKAPIWKLITHDLSKFGSKEFTQYAKRFLSNNYDEDEFLLCWINHQNKNPHHWEYWVSRPKSSVVFKPDVNWQPAPMPMWAVREMLADWMGASRTYSGFWPDPKNWVWVNENMPDMILHDKTKERIAKVIEELKNENG